MVVTDGRSVDCKLAFEGLARLASRDETRRCFVRQWIQFSVDRAGMVTSTGAQQDRARIEVAVRAFAVSGFQLRDLIVAVTRTNTFIRP